MEKTDERKDVFTFGGEAVTKKFQELVLQRFPQLSTKGFEYFEQLKMNVSSLVADGMECEMKLDNKLFGDVTKEFKEACDVLLHPEKYSLATMSLAEFIAKKDYTVEYGNNQYNNLDVILGGGPAKIIDLGQLQKEISAILPNKKIKLVRPPVRRKHLHFCET